MTALASWCAWDQNGHSSVYIAADSLITWSDGRHSLEQKLFPHDSEPQIVGYCGDREWGTDLCKDLLNSVSINVDAAVFSSNAHEALQAKTADLPSAFHSSCDVVLVARVQGQFMILAHHVDAKSRNVTQMSYPLPNKSDKIDFWGSGRSRLMDLLDQVVFQFRLGDKSRGVWSFLRLPLFRGRAILFRAAATYRFVR